MSDKKRVSAMLLAIAVLFVMLFSAFYIAKEADHDCCGGDCSICYQISVCESTLKSVGQAIGMITLAIFVGVFVLLHLSYINKPARHSSPVTLKVKLSN
ncbi:MAG: hypothetical protein Q4E54_01280 [Lachnospiraceae bacterium]|nr:hypothetical protein [Lachnospiraceae bacterium]